MTERPIPADQSASSALRQVAVLGEVADERERQDMKWGQQNHPDRFFIGRDDAEDGEHLYDYEFRACLWRRRNEARVAERNSEGAAPDRNAAWDGVLLEEVYEALAESDPARLRAELIQVAAVAVAWVEAIDRREATDA
jgi:hypothetical protein